MMFRCYPEGDFDNGLLTFSLAGRIRDRTLESMLVEMADEYARGRGEQKRINVVIEPIDDEARALPGWHPAETDEPDAQPFRMLVATPTVKVTWSTREVPTFNPHGKGFVA